MKKKTLALAFLGVGLFSTSLLYEQVAEASDELEAVAPFNITSTDWKRYRVTSNTETKSLTFRQAAGSSYWMPEGPGSKAFSGAYWDGMGPSSIKHLKFMLREGDGSYSKEGTYVKFSAGYSHTNYWSPFSNVATIEGLENMYIVGNTSRATDFTGFFSNLKQVKALDVSNILMYDQDGRSEYNMTNFLKGMSGLEVLVLSGDSTTDKPNPKHPQFNINFRRFYWGTYTTTTGFLDLANGATSNLREITYNSNRTPLNGKNGATKLKIKPGKWVRLDRPQHLGGKPIQVNGKYQFLNWETLFMSHSTNDKRETWALDVWDLEHGGEFKPIKPGDPIPKPTYPVQITKSDAKSNVNIAFKSLSDTPVAGDPVVINPNQPGSNPEKIDSDKSSGTQGTGTRDFYINWVSDLDFGTAESTGGELAVSAQKIKMTPINISSYETSPFIQVTDLSTNRRAWTLSVKGEPLKHTSGEVLPNASITLGEGIVSQSNSKDQPSQKPTFVGQDKNLVSGNDIDIFKASKDSQSGIWSVLFEKDGIPTSTFKLPKGSTVKSGGYTSTLTWILKQEP